MDLIDKKYTWNQLGNTLVYVSVDDFIDFTSEFVSDLCFLGLHDLSHQTHEIVPSLWLRISHIQIMKGHILNDFFFLMNVSLW